MKNEQRNKRLRKLATVLFVAILNCSLLHNTAHASEKRCGWFENPTPRNAWLTDSSGQWIIATQGGHQADGDWPDFPDKEWVITNSGSHGYGCACMDVIVDRSTKEVLKIIKAQPKLLSDCRKDKSLKEPENPLKGNYDDKN